MSQGMRAKVLAIALLLGSTAACTAADQKPVPKAAVDSSLTGIKREQTAVLAGGCFWGLQAVFQRLKGVVNVTSGYTGGSVPHPDYEQVSTGDTGHAESVKITYNPAQVTYGDLLRVYFSVATDPTQLNRQESDEGTQYRSAIFFGNEEQKKIAEDYIAQLTKAKVFPNKIVTQVVPLKEFYPAEGYHQNYYDLHPDSPYIMFRDKPKVTELKQEFPSLYQEPTTAEAKK